MLQFLLTKIGKLKSQIAGVDASKAEKWKIPENWVEAVAGSMIMIAATGVANSNKVGMTLIIPVSLIGEEERYWQAGDAYNTGTTMLHLQCAASTDTFRCHLYYGSSIVTDEDIKVYYQ